MWGMVPSGATPVMSSIRFDEQRAAAGQARGPRAQQLKGEGDADRCRGRRRCHGRRKRIRADLAEQEFLASARRAQQKSVGGLVNHAGFHWFVWQERKSLAPREAQERAADGGLANARVCPCEEDALHAPVASSMLAAATSTRRSI